MFPFESVFIISEKTTGYDWNNGRYREKLFIHNSNFYEFDPNLSKHERAYDTCTTIFLAHVGIILLLYFIIDISWF